MVVFEYFFLACTPKQSAQPPHNETIRKGLIDFRDYFGCFSIDFFWGGRGGNTYLEYITNPVFKQVARALARQSRSKLFVICLKPGYTERDSKIGPGLQDKLPRFDDHKSVNIRNMNRLAIDRTPGL